ncbi:MAG: DEAD/DEAH box helicase [Clostridium sp.]|nr:DEAD/DEAH box helicase [Clostridium sp.]
MTLKDILKRIGERHGVEELNPMQKKAVSAKSERVILLAPTGSGKTLAFTIPLVERLQPSDGKVQAVIVAPSRELVIQIANIVRPVANGEGNGAHKTVALYGGHSMQEEINSLQPVPDIVVATPGRLLDHALRGTIDLAPVRSLVLDEYDKALELGFHDQMRRIVKRMKSLKYVMLTSATRLYEMPDFIDLSQAKVIDYADKNSSPRERMDVHLVRSDSRDKLQALHQLLESLPNGKTIVFVNHRESAERVYDFLNRKKMPVGLYHGGLDQLQREVAIDMLNNGTTPILASTDLGSRGLDIEGVRSVVHYHLPPTQENWTHRNGRTARVDATGDVYVLASEGEKIPDYIDFDDEYVPAEHMPNGDPIRSDVSTLYLNVGKKEKVSKGDVLGFLTKQCGLRGDQVGKIVVKDHCVVAAIPSDKAQEVISIASAAKIKGQRAKASLF